MPSERGDLHGYCGVITSETDAGEITKTPLRRCCHCGYMWAVVKGSGKLRGYCTNCDGFCCGRPWCVGHGCTIEARALENMEAGMMADRAYAHTPISVSVPVEIPRG